MDIFLYITSNIIIPILVAIITVILTKFINNKSKYSKLIVIYTKDLKENVKDKIIYEKYNKNLQFEHEFKKRLKEYEYLSTYYIDDLLYKTYKIYKTKQYKNYNIIMENEINKICKMINFFKDDFEFMFHIKRYEVFFENSLWNFKIINIGKSTIYNLNIEFKKNTENNKVICKDLLKFNEFIDLNVVYFDLGIRINSFDFGSEIPFDFGYSKHTNISYYLVKKKKYNKKDEILFNISYLDQKAKIKEYFFCSKVVKKNNTY